MKKWQQWVLYICLVIPGILLMSRSMANWGKVPVGMELVTIAGSVVFCSLSLVVWYKYKLHVKPIQFIREE